MEMNQSLHDIISTLPADFIEKVKTTEEVSQLIQMKKKLRNPNKIAVIDARIQNINYLVI